MFVIAAHLTQNDTLLWVNTVINASEGLVLLVVIWVLIHWAKRIVEFTDLMDEVTQEEKRLRSRLMEWDGLMDNEEQT